MRWRFWLDTDPGSVALAQQKALLRREKRLQRQIRAMYAVAGRALESEIQRLVQKLEEAWANGIEPQEWWLYEIGRLDSLERQWQAWAIETAGKAGPMVDLVRLDVVNLGAAHAKAMGTAIGTSFNALPRQALAIILENTADGRPLAERFLRAGTKAAIEASQTLIEGVTIGLNPKKIGRSLARILDTSVQNGQVIARTEVLRSYRQANQETYRLNADVAKGWRWLATQDSRTCPICLALHGTEHPLQEPFVSHPSCRCTTTPVVEGVDYGATGQELFDQMPMADKIEVFGPTKARLLTEQKIPILALVQKQDNEWGGTLRELTLSQMVERGLVTRDQVAGASIKKAA